MAAKNVPELKVPENEDKELDAISKQLEDMSGGLTIFTPEKKPDYTGPLVDIFLPELEGGGDGGAKVDQYEHVTIANGETETLYRVHRGEHVQVPVPVFVILKEKYPKI